MAKRLSDMENCGKHIVYEDMRGGRGQLRTVWRDTHGCTWVYWYGDVRRVELERLLNFPADGMVSERYVIDWHWRMV